MPPQSRRSTPWRMRAVWPDALEDVVEAVRQAEVLDRGDGVVDRAGVDEVGGAEAAGHRLLVGVGVDHDDAAGGGDAGGLDGRLADAAGADDRHRLARLDLGPVEHRPGAGDDRAADEAGSLERDLGVDDDGLGLCDHDLLGEHAGVGEAEGLLAAGREGPLVPPERVSAVGRLAPVAGVAAPAVAQRGQHDVVADLHLGDGVADLLDHTGALVAEDDGRREHDRAVDDRDVAVAQAGVVDAHPHLVGSRVAHVDVVAHLQVTRPDDPLHGVPLIPATRATGARCRRTWRSCRGRGRRPTA